MKKGAKKKTKGAEVESKASDDEVL